MVRLMYKLYKKTSKPIPYWAQLGDDTVFVWPGAAIIIGNKIYTEPDSIGEHETDSGIWKIEAENVYFARKK